MQLLIISTSVYVYPLTSAYICMNEFGVDMGLIGNANYYNNKFTEKGNKFDDHIFYMYLSITLF